MRYQPGVSIANFFLITFSVCAILGLVAVDSHRVFALTVGDILNSPKVLGDSTGNSFAYPTAGLVNDHGTIYFISGATKVPFTNYKAFIGLGYSIKNVVSGDLSNYSLSQNYVINSANGRHPWGSWLSYKGVVYYLSQDGMIGVPSAAIFLANQGQWNLVVKANSYDIAILKASPGLPVLTTNDSRIISQPVLQFSGSSVPNNSAPVISTPLAVTATSATSTISYLPQLVLPANIYASTTATFSAPSADPYGPLTYTFNWDDGSIANSLLISSAVHTYADAGVYILNVSVTDSEMNSYSTTTAVTVVLPPNQTPSAPQFSLPSGIIVGAPVTVTAGASDPQNSPLVYTFSWGDGTADTLAPSNSATHTYSTSNTFIVKVTATNGLGFFNSATNYLYVAP